MLKRGDNGADVRALQSALIELGYDLPRWGADGDLGTETVDAVARFLRAHDQTVDDDADVVSDAELALLHRVLKAKNDRGSSGFQLDAASFHDVRANAVQSQVGGRRSWKQVTGITLHQKRCHEGSKSSKATPVSDRQPPHLNTTLGRATLPGRATRAKCWFT